MSSPKAYIDTYAEYVEYRESSHVHWTAYPKAHKYSEISTILNCHYTLLTDTCSLRVSGKFNYKVNISKHDFHKCIIYVFAS